MYKVAAAIVVLMLFAACHSDGQGMAWDGGPDESKSVGGSMEELTIRWLGTDTPLHKEKEVTIDVGRGITVDIEMYDEDGSVTDSCTGQAEITDEDYETVTLQLQVADLVNYQPPAADDENCETTSALRGLSIVYSYSNGEEVSEVAFETGKCAIAAEIENLATVVNGLAANYVTDCTDETMIFGGGDETETEETPEADDTETGVDETEPGTVPETESDSDDEVVDKVVFVPGFQVE